MSKRKKKKLKSRSKEELPRKGKAKTSRSSKKGKDKVSVKALVKEIKRLTRKLEAKDDEIRALKTRREVEQTLSTAVEESPSDALTDSTSLGSIGDRKRIWERHQYLRARYEHHLEAAKGKPEARRLADKDLRERYGEDAGYTDDQLEGILS